MSQVSEINSTFLPTGVGGLCKELWKKVPCPCMQQGLCAGAGKADWYVQQSLTHFSLGFVCSILILFNWNGSLMLSLVSKQRLFVHHFASAVSHMVYLCKSHLYLLLLCSSFCFFLPLPLTPISLFLVSQLWPSFILSLIFSSHLLSYRFPSVTLIQ